MRPIGTRGRIVWGAWAAALLGSGLTGMAAAADRPVDTGGAAYQREEVFNFTQQPTCRQLGKDQFEVRFASQGYCDVAVGIIDAGGNYVRHLAAGVLGHNAPLPLQKDSLEQRLIWDGKNDLGRYVESPLACRVKVMLGLKPTLDKVLLSSPNRMPWAIYGLTADKDGVYVFNTEGNPTMTTAHQPPDLTNILVYSHAGDYQRTILPLPASKVEPQRYKASPMHGQPARAKLDAAPEMPFSFALPTGKLVVSPDNNGRYLQPLEANAFTVIDGVLTAVVYPGPHASFLEFFRLQTDGAMPPGGFYTKQLGDRGGTGPCWIAASPDHQNLYMSGLGGRERDWHGMSWGWNVRDRKQVAQHAVYRLRLDMTEPLAQPFLGVRGEPGGDDKHFSYPEGVATDGQGRVYVCDKGNNRVQVFSAEGKLVKSITVAEPYQSAVDDKTGALYVLSYPVKLRELHLIKFKGLDDPTIQAEQVWRESKMGLSLLPTFCLDRWAERPTLWVVDPNYHVQLWTDQGDRFALLRDLHADLRKEWNGAIVEDAEGGSGFSSNFLIGNLTAHPTLPYLYCGDSRGGGPIYRGALAPRINVETGQVEITRAATVIGWDGLAYVKDGNEIRRFDPVTGKAVAFDYGAGESGTLNYPFSSEDGIGFGVSPTGEIIYHDRWPPVPGLVKTHEEFHVAQLNTMRIPSYMRQERWAGGKDTSLKGYTMRQFFPGQVYQGSGAVLVYDQNGQMKTNDVVGGLPRVSAGCRMDLAGNVYVGIPMAKLVDGQPVAGHSVVKFGPQGGKLVVDGPGVPIPLLDPPKRPADFKPLMSVNPQHDDKGPHGEMGYGDKAWGEGMFWCFGGYFPFNDTKCVCLNARFDLDMFARCFVPESYRNSVAVVDTNGNFILRFGQYGNQDDRGPDIRMAHVRYLAVNDQRAFLNDVGNKRIVSVRLGYEREATTEIRGEGPTARPGP